MAEPLYCPPKSIITLLIGYTPIQNKLKKKNNLGLSAASLGLPHPSFPQALISFRSRGSLFWLDGLPGEGGVTGEKESSLVARTREIGVCLSLTQEEGTKSCFSGVG